jgi:PAS domain S-box-containing protein
LENRSNILEKIEETETRFRTLFLSAPIGIYRTTPDRGIVFANPRLLTMLGYNSLEELTQNQSNMDFYQDKNHVVAFLHTINTTEAVTDFETVWKTRSGNEIIVNENVRVVKNHLGKIVFHDGIVEDVTERVESQRKLIDSEIKYRTVADYTYDWEYWISPNGNIVFMSPSVEQITGYKISQFVDNPELLTTIIHSDDRYEWDKHIVLSHNPSLTDDHHETTFRIIAKNGNIRWISHVCRRIFVQGEYLGIRVSNRDTTEQIEAEKKLMNVTIEVEERERARYSRELHDGLGPLLSTIKLYFQWLSEYVQDDKGKIITQKGNQNIDLAIQTTREIAFNLSPRILENMGLQEALKVFIQNINDLQGIYIDFSSNSIERYDKNIEITVYRIVTELINNTIKYAKASKVVICLESNSEKPTITLYYSDNGIGFDFKETEILKKGLGLKNLMQRVKTMRGVLNIDSQPGKGMRVTVVLPAHGRL